MFKIIVEQPDRIGSLAALAKVPHGVENEVIIRGVQVGIEPESSFVLRTLLAIPVLGWFLQKLLIVPARKARIKFCSVRAVELLTTREGDGEFARAGQWPAVEGGRELVENLKKPEGFYGQIDVRARIFPNGKLYVQLKEPIEEPVLV